MTVPVCVSETAHDCDKNKVLMDVTQVCCEMFERQEEVETMR